MKNKKPEDINEYKKWLREKHDVEISERVRTYYGSVTHKIEKDFENSSLWIQLNENLEECCSRYLLKTGYNLLISEFKPKLNIKPFDSLLLKTFRKNVLENKNWPDEPERGWILPNNWYSRINDIIRTLFVVKYLDGINSMIEEIQSLCGEQGLSFHVDLEAKEEGYYAAHLYTKQEFEIPRVTWDTETVEVSIEIQVTSQLQEVIRKLLHRHYEERRKSVREEDLDWQWNYKSDEFATNYLGHILHYVEGMIMEIREKQKGEEKI